MKCENLQFNLSVYLDDWLIEQERALVDEHLARCPLCRQKLADFQVLRNALRVLPRPAMPNDLLAATRNRVAQAAGGGQPKFSVFHTESFGEWLQKRLMPYAVGTAASLLFGLTLLWMLLSAAYIPRQNTELAKAELPIKPTVLLTNSNSNNGAPAGDYELDAAE